MSDYKELKATPDFYPGNEVTVSTFGGGKVRGNCFQLSQYIDDGPEPGYQFIQLTEDQLDELFELVKEMRNES